MFDYYQNIMIMCDSYKVTHFRQYPPLKEMVAYIEARNTKSESEHLENSVVFFGLQYYIKRYFYGQVVTKEKRLDARTFWLSHFGSKDLFVFNEFGLMDKDGSHKYLKKMGVNVNLADELFSGERKLVPCEWIFHIANKKKFYNADYFFSLSLKDLTKVKEDMEKNPMSLKYKVMGGWFDIERPVNKGGCGGKLPIKIVALPEGTVTKVGMPLFIIRNTSDPVGQKFAWVTNYLETLAMQTWHPVTIASNSFVTRLLIIKSLTNAGNNLQFAKIIADFMMHDFGFRGTSSTESAALGGAAHLLSFKGTDTANSIRLAQLYYSANKEAGVLGQSVPAAEHSVITSYTRYRENEGIKHILNEFGGNMGKDGPVTSIVADSFNVYRMIKYYLGILCRKIVDKRKWDPVNGKFGRVVMRPDSGKPLHMVLLLNQLAFDTFGYDDSNGFKSLEANKAILQGDGISFYSTAKILAYMLRLKMSPSNMVFGSGGALLQKWNRDSLGFAIKATKAVHVDGTNILVAKEPITAPGKTSKTYDVVKKLLNETLANMQKKKLLPKKYDCTILKWNPDGTQYLFEDTFDSIRNRLEKQLDEMLSTDNETMNFVNSLLKVPDEKFKQTMKVVNFMKNTMPMYACQAEFEGLRKIYPKLPEKENKIGLDIAKKMVEENRLDRLSIKYCAEMVLATMADQMNPHDLIDKSVYEKDRKTAKKIGQHIMKNKMLDKKLRKRLEKYI